MSVPDHVLSWHRRQSDPAHWLAGCASALEDGASLGAPLAGRPCCCGSWLRPICPSLPAELWRASWVPGWVGPGCAERGEQDTCPLQAQSRRLRKCHGHTGAGRCEGPGAAGSPGARQGGGGLALLPTDSPRVGACMAGTAALCGHLKAGAVLLPRAFRQCRTPGLALTQLPHLCSPWSPGPGLPVHWVAHGRGLGRRKGGAGNWGLNSAPTGRMEASGPPGRVPGEFSGGSPHCSLELWLLGAVSPPRTFQSL